ncbi:hypothetical protein [Hymenobacter nivis]|uniref:Uncharacterized protein n=1 Tax=Hymenobacter nivis TaxID=1850093 RepID=A0A502G807_9BACT|nr:hypothetical protein [Hymenobacter nivis]TPG58019.1 hypothetical protein EAH73_22765 [Hymenobacter nivis]
MNLSSVLRTYRQKWWLYLPFQLLGIFMLYWGFTAPKKDFEALYRAKAAGIITSLDSGDHNSSITVELDDNDAQRYRFFPVGEQGARVFLANASLGDSLRKRAFSDTLFLGQQDRVVPYRFKHP